MKPIQLQVTVTIGSETLTNLFDSLVKAVQQGTTQCQPTTVFKAVERPLEAAEGKPEPPRPKMTPLEASRNAHFGGQKPPEDMGLLVDSRQVAKMLGVSPRKLWQMHNSAEMPEPVRIGRAVRWCFEELRAWVNAGCPPKDKWAWRG